MRATGLVCLGAGAGLIRGDLRDVHGTDVIIRSGGVIVQVRSARERTVPVLPRYHELLLAAAASAGDGLVLCGADPGRRNLTSQLVTALPGGSGLPRLDTSRLRATWLRDCAELPGLATFMHAAGITCSQRLGDLMDRETLLAHESQWVTEKSPTRATLSGLTSDEQNLYRDLVNATFGPAVRLEQERVSFTSLEHALRPLDDGAIPCV
jgi:hypothetical protein